MRRFAPVIAVALVLILGANLALAAKMLTAQARPRWNDDRMLTILAIGSDMGLPRAGSPLNGRADAIHLIAVDTKKLRATIVDIPRDSFISGDKVNAFLQAGGPDRLVSVLESYSGVKLDYYVLTSFRGLRGLVNGIGGVPITLEAPINDSASKANLRGGPQKLGSAEALAYSRARKSVAGGDFGRTRHQGELIRAAHKHLRDRDTGLLSLTRALATFAHNTVTDIPPTELFRMASLALDIKPANIKQVSLSGPTGFVGAASVVHLAPGSAFSDIRAGRVGP